MLYFDFYFVFFFFFFFQAEDGIRDLTVTGVQTCALPICADCTCPQAWWDGVPFERILADVPCSASGVVRRHPDIKWLRRAGDVAGFRSEERRVGKECRSRWSPYH